MEIEQLKRHRWTGVRIAQKLGLSPATVSRVLRAVEAEPHSPCRAAGVTHREHAAPGDLLHLDIKRLVRIRRPYHRVAGDRGDGVKGIGAEFLHVAIDDRSRLAFTATYPDQTARGSAHFLAAAVAWYGQLGITIQRLLTDNGPCYKANSFACSCGPLGLKHRRTRPYTPRTNGKAERFIQTAINEWARMGLRPHLPKLRRKDSLTPSMDPPVQLAQTHASLNQQRQSAEQL